MNKKFSMKNLLDSRGFSAFMATMMAIVIGLIFGYLVRLIASPANAGLGFTSILTGGLSKMGDVFYYATPILMTGLAVGFAFKMGLFNIGASGQYNQYHTEISHRLRDNRSLFFCSYGEDGRPSPCTPPCLSLWESCRPNGAPIEGLTFNGERKNNVIRRLSAPAGLKVA